MTPEEVARFERDGYVHLRGVLAPDELDELESVFERFLRRQIHVPGRDFCDMSGGYLRLRPVTAGRWGAVRRRGHVGSGPAPIIPIRWSPAVCC